MKITKSHNNDSWQWFSVKLIFEAIISGKSDPDTIDRNYTNDIKTYEESIVLIKAQSFDHAYKIAEEKAIKEIEHSYENPYDEIVEWKFIEAIDCFSLCEESLETGTEIYSRYIRVPKQLDTQEVLDKYYPDTIIENTDIDYNFRLRYKEFNRRPNTKE